MEDVRFQTTQRNGGQSLTQQRGKNFLFHDTVDGANASAIVMSLIETAKANNLNIYQYLYTLLLYMPDYKNEPAGIKQLMPWSEFIKENCSGINRYRKNTAGKSRGPSYLRSPGSRHGWLFIAYSILFQRIFPLASRFVNLFISKMRKLLFCIPHGSVLSVLC